MNPKAGKACSIIKPDAPTAAEPADNADPGEIAEVKARQREEKAGKYGSVKAAPYKPGDEPDEEKESHWIEIELIDESDKPVPGEKYEIELPDGRVRSGMLDGEGHARLRLEEAGNCKISFPRLDAEAWEFVESVGEKYPPEKVEMGGKKKKSKSGSSK